MNILGISAFTSDSAACLVQDGKVVAGVKEENLSRVSHDVSFPLRSVEFCLKHTGISIDQIDCIALSHNPSLEFESRVKNYVRMTPRNFTSLYKEFFSWGKGDCALIKRYISDSLGFTKDVFFVESHDSRAFASLYLSGFESAAIVNVGNACNKVQLGIFNANQYDLVLKKEIHFPHSLETLCSALAQYVGLKENTNLQQMQWAACTAKPIYHDQILTNLINVKDDGSYNLNLKYFSDSQKDAGYRNFENFLGFSSRNESDFLRKEDKSLCASMTSVYEEILFKLIRTAKTITQNNNLILSGCAVLNKNNFFSREYGFDHFWQQGLLFDECDSIGSALYVSQQKADNLKGILKRKEDSFFVGPQYEEFEIEGELNTYGIVYQKIKDIQQECGDIVDFLRKGSIVGFFEGSMEFASALSTTRCMLASPLLDIIEEKISVKMKHQNGSCELFLVCLDEHKEALQIQLPRNLRKKYDNRVRFITKKQNPLLCEILQRFFAETQCPALLVSSLSMSNEPVACSPIDTFHYFFSTEMNLLVMNQFIVSKEEQNIERVGRIFQTDELVMVS